jgi:hypothetical protein
LNTDADSSETAFLGIGWLTLYYQIVEYAAVRRASDEFDPALRRKRRDAFRAAAELNVGFILDGTVIKREINTAFRFS